ncbi:hypothetical protein COV93_06460 [Candidatus Woesearchaeota archaeon CG11_big_fil_rev_8_21_14_0_20_43_8]|nr:MAG: hypothetical protein COV93_06460 [Candidatus Woesearchaeota archaeon CG11_big_fil_rev_8_21_14_0_20_43_8]
MKSKITILVSLASFLLGLFFLMGTGTAMVGAVIGTSHDASWESAIGLVFLMGAAAMLALGVQARRIDDHFKVEENIKDPHLGKLVRDAMKHPETEREVYHLEAEMKKGNFKAGLGTRHLEGTNLNYMRGKKEGRIFYHQTGPNELEIVGICHKHDEQKAIDKLVEKYGKEKEYTN